MEWASEVPYMTLPLPLTCVLISLLKSKEIKLKIWVQKEI